MGPSAAVLLALGEAAKRPSRAEELAAAGQQQQPQGFASRLLNALATMPTVEAAKQPFRGASAVYSADPYTEEGAHVLNQMGDRGAEWAASSAVLPAVRMPFAQPGQLGMFGGRMAQTADLPALARAEEMAAKGVGERDIWDQTGWFRGADDKWRFEIDDSGAARTATMESAPYAAHLRHPQAQAAYPDFGSLPTYVGDHTRSARGTYWPRMDEVEDSIEVYAKTAPEQRDVLLHEGQHAIQAREGFGVGGNANVLKPGSPAWGIYQERLGEIRQSMAQHDMKELPAFVDKAAQEYAIEQAYKRMSGEVEARNVQKRKDMTAEERRRSAPWETEDTPRNQQFVRFR